MIVLDTHAWIWYVDDPEHLSSKVRTAVEAAAESGDVYVSCISTWEVLMLEKKHRLKLSIPAEVWIERCQATGVFSFVPLDNSISRLSVSLGLHGDPADRFIAATAVYLGARLITKDRKLRDSRKVDTLW